MEEIKNLFKSFFKKEYLKEYVIITLLTFGSFLIVPTFTLMGYVANATQYSSTNKEILKVAREKGLLRLTKEGFFLSVFIFLVSLLFNLIAALVSGLILFSGLSMKTSYLVVGPLLLVFTFLLYALIVSYCKERSFVGAFSQDVIKYLTDFKFYIYVLISVIVLLVFSLTVFGLGIGLVLSYAIIGLVIEN